MILHRRRDSRDDREDDDGDDDDDAVVDEDRTVDQSTSDLTFLYFFETFNSLLTRDRNLFFTRLLTERDFE